MQKITIELTITGPDGTPHRFALEDYSNSPEERLAAYLEWAERPIGNGSILRGETLGELDHHYET